MKIYKLKPCPEGHHKVLKVENLDILRERKHDLSSIKPIKDLWNPFYVTLIKDKPKWPTVDTPGLFPGFFVIRQRIVDLIGDVLIKYGELLPLHSSDDSFFIYNVNNIIYDALDIKNSSIFFTRYPGCSAMTSVDIFKFHEDSIGESSIFRIPQFYIDKAYPDIYVTEDFKNLVRRKKIVGWQFEMIWDSQNPNFHDQRWRLEQWLHVKKVRDAEEKKALSSYSDSKFESYKSRELSEDEFVSVQNSISCGFKFLNENGYTINEKDSPRIVIEAISDLIDKLRNLLDPEYSIIIGILFGEQVCKEYGWSWSIIEDISNNECFYGIISNDSLVFVKPLSFISQYFADLTIEKSVLIMFNILKDTHRIPIKLIPSNLVPFLLPGNDW